MPDKKTAYYDALSAMEKQYLSNENSTIISAAMAQWWLNNNEYKPLEGDLHKTDLKTAFDICEKAVKRAPKSYGAGECEQIMTTIKEKNLHLQTELVWTSKEPLLVRSTFRNVKKMFVRVINFTEEQENKNIDTSQ